MNDYFEQFANNQFIMYELIHEKPGLQKLYKQRFTRGYKRYKETSGLMEWKIGHIFHSIFT